MKLDVMDTCHGGDNIHGKKMEQGNKMYVTSLDKLMRKTNLKARL